MSANESILVEGEKMKRGSSALKLSLLGVRSGPINKKKELRKFKKNTLF